MAEPEARLPAHLEVSALIRQVQSEGGFGMVLQRGERDAGTILVVLIERGRPARLYERMPSLDGTRAWHCSRRAEDERDSAFSDYVERRGRQDPDTWLVELDIVQGERIIGLPVDEG